MVVWVDDNIFVFDGVSTKQIHLDNLFMFLHSQRLVFLDLQNYSHNLIDLFRKKKISFKQIVVFDLKFYLISVGTVTFKCYKNFGIDDHCPKEIYKKLILIENRLLDQLNLDLRHYKINSLAGISSLLMGKLCGKNAFLPLTAENETVVRSAFYGGRCEFFCTSVVENVWVFDFYSMYPTLMLEEFPTSISLPTDVDENNLRPGFYELQGFLAGAVRPFLPFRRNGVCYPSGYVSGVYWFEEVVFFKKLGGRVLNIKCCLHVGGFKTIFLKFIIFCFEERRLGFFYAKLLANSAWGRLALNNRGLRYKYVEVFDESSELKNVDFSEAWLYDSWAIVAYKTENTNIKEKNLIAAAVTTSRARIRLYTTAEFFEKQGAIIYGFDTDAIFTSKKIDVGCGVGRWVFYKNLNFSCKSGLSGRLDEGGLF